MMNVDEANAILRALDAGEGPMATAVLAERLSVSARQARRRLDNLRSSGLVRTEGRRGFVLTMVGRRAARLDR